MPVIEKNHIRLSNTLETLHKQFELNLMLFSNEKGNERIPEATLSLGREQTIY